MLLVSAVRYTVETARDQTLLIFTNFVITLNQIEFITATLDKCNFSFNIIKLIEIDFQYILKMDWVIVYSATCHFYQMFAWPSTNNFQVIGHSCRTTKLFAQLILRNYFEKHVIIDVFATSFSFLAVGCWDLIENACLEAEFQQKLLSNTFGILFLHFVKSMDWKI